jgi:hypothetical protein
MEALLNALWLLVAVALVFIWRMRWLPQIRELGLDQRRRQSFVGLACVVFFLFPAISLSDDLHAPPVTLPDTKSSYAAMASGHSSSSRASRSRAPLHTALGPALAPRFHVSLGISERAVAHAAVPVSKDPLPQAVSDRAPPFLS